MLNCKIGIHTYNTYERECIYICNVFVKRRFLYSYSFEIDINYVVANMLNWLRIYLLDWRNECGGMRDFNSIIFNGRINNSNSCMKCIQYVSVDAVILNHHLCNERFFLLLLSPSYLSMHPYFVSTFISLY